MKSATELLNGQWNNKFYGNNIYLNNEKVSVDLMDDEQVVQVLTAKVHAILNFFSASNYTIEQMENYVRTYLPFEEQYGAFSAPRTKNAECWLNGLISKTMILNESRIIYKIKNFF